MVSLFMAVLISISVGFSVPSIAKDYSDYTNGGLGAATAPEIEQNRQTESIFDFPTTTNYTNYIEVKSINSVAPYAVVEPPINPSKSYDSFMQIYFQGLKKNMGENERGSCGYIALGMLLSYYDTYLNDGIIQEKYDVAAQGTNFIIMDENSPGTLNDALAEDDYISCGYKVKPDTASNLQYFNVLCEKRQNSLHAQLLILGFEYINFNSEESFALTMTNTVNVLKNYFDSRSFSKDLYTITTYDEQKDDIKAKIKENIDKGNPVLTLVRNSKNQNGHFVICYDYDSYNIYGNMGWTTKEEYSHYVVADKYDVFEEAMVIEFNMSHSHSRNYKVKLGNKTYSYCYCESPFFTNNLTI